MKRNKDKNVGIKIYRVKTEKRKTNKQTNKKTKKKQIKKKEAQTDRQTNQILLML